MNLLIKMDVRCILPINSFEELNLHKFQIFKFKLRHQLAGNSSKRQKHRSISTSINPPENNQNNYCSNDKIDDINASYSQDTDRINLSVLLNREYDIFSKEYLETPIRNNYSPKYREIKQKVTPIKYKKRKYMPSKSVNTKSPNPVSMDYSIIGRPLSCTPFQHSKSKRPMTSMNFVGAIKRKTKQQQSVGHLSSKSLQGWENP